MAKLNIAPTKSNFLSLKRQLAFAEEGRDLLEQKRQLLVLELMNRLARAQEMERTVAAQLQAAYAALHEAVLAGGSASLERATLGVAQTHELKPVALHLMGLRLPKVTVRVSPVDSPFGVVGVSAGTDLAMRRFAELLPLLAELAELQNAVLRLARELRKTQRRCNALSKIFIPSYRDTIDYIAGTLEERERESLTILKMVRNRLDGANSFTAGADKI